MFGQYKVIAWLVGAGVVAAAIGLHLFGDWRTKSELSKVQAELVATKESKRILEENFVAATRDRDQLRSQAAEADAARAKVQADLAATLKKLRSQKPPVECKAAVDWAIERKGDLSW